ncbi:MAG: hypothetical protein ACTHU0_28745 [Kofleriaceae bacterium]
MSASRSSRSACAIKKKASPAVAATRAPWIRDGIDYGPARAAVHDLATWALDIAERAVCDWPAGLAHVRNTRRFVTARINGKRPRRASIDDVMFTARLLARIFEDELRLELTDALTIFDSLCLPLDVVPIRRPARSATLHPLTRPPAPVASTAVLPLRFCDECGYVHEPGSHVHYRRAA